MLVRFGRKGHRMLAFFGGTTQGLLAFVFCLLFSLPFFTKPSDELFTITLQQFTLILCQFVSAAKIIDRFGGPTLRCRAKLTCVADLSPAFYATVCPDDEMDLLVDGVSAAFALALYSVIERNFYDSGQMPRQRFW